MSNETVTATSPFLPDLPPLITTEEGERLGFNGRSLRLWCEQGKVKATKIGRRWYIPTADLLRQFGLMD